MPVTAWATAGTVSATTWVVSDAGTAVNALSAEGNPAIWDDGTVDSLIILSNFGFSLPAGAIVEGIEVQYNSAIGDGAILPPPSPTPLTSISTTKDATSVYGTGKTHTPAAKYPSLSSPWTIQTDGGAADLWGGSFIDSEVNAVGLGFIINGLNNESPDIGRAFAYFAARVYYSEVIVPPPAVMAAMGEMQHIPGYGIERLDAETRNS